MKRKKKISLVIPAFLVLLFVFGTVISGLERDRQAEGKQQLEEVLRRTAVTCYAAEGFYPPGVEYMREHYGLQYDPSQYTVYYEWFASNLMPDITVLEK